MSLLILNLFKFGDVSHPRLETVCDGGACVVSACHKLLSADTSVAESSCGEGNSHCTELQGGAFQGGHGLNYQCLMVTGSELALNSLSLLFNFYFLTLLDGSGN